MLRLPVVDRQNTGDREEPLGVIQLVHRREHGAVLDRADDVPPVGRNLREQPERRFLVFPAVVAPRDDVALFQDGPRPHVRDDVRPLVAAVVDIHGERLAVACEGMAVAAYLHARQQGGWLVGRDLAQTPANRLDVVQDVAERQGHVTVKDGRSHRVRGDAECHAPARQGFAGLVTAEAHDRRGHGLPAGNALDELPDLGGRHPSSGRDGRSRRLVGRRRGRGRPRVGVTCLRRRGPLREHVETIVCVRDGNVDQPGIGLCGWVAPDEGGCGHIGREHRLIERVVNRERRRPGVG